MGTLVHHKLCYSNHHTLFLCVLLCHWVDLNKGSEVWLPLILEHDRSWVDYSEHSDYLSCICWNRWTSLYSSIINSNIDIISQNLLLFKNLLCYCCFGFNDDSNCKRHDLILTCFVHGCMCILILFLHSRLKQQCNKDLFHWKQYFQSTWILLGLNAWSFCNWWFWILR